ncbi:MAG: tryptophan synthase subunit beta [Candidatus Gracilibacteria bacterium]|nr:tryptophan synthase subunit beta [Candidatus Gracilibacteria bacterium]
MKLKNIIINPNGHFGEFGGRYVPELLVPIMDEIKDAFFKLKKDKNFIKDLKELHKNYIGRPSPLVYAKNLTEKLGGAQIHLKNEGVNHTGAHKINHSVGQALVAKYLGKKRIIAETGAGQHGLATAAICAKLGLECIIYMGKKDYDRQRPNVIYMELAGAKVIPVYEGNQTLRDAVNAALKDLVNNSENTYYLLGTACGPNPYPSMNVYFQKIIGEEVRKQLQPSHLAPLLQGEEKELLPDYMVACVGGGSNALGFFYDFLDEESVKLIGVEAGGKGIKSGLHAARFVNKKIGFVEGYKSYFIQDNDGQIKDTYSISAGLDYSGVSPQMAYLENIKRVEMTFATDDETLNAVKTLMQTEGILPALESAHAVAHTIKLAPKLKKEQIIVCNLSGRGDKDLFITAPKFDEKFIDFLNEYIKKYN